MSIIVGIDLGTTFSATALVQEGVPQILEYNGERIMPSVVSLNPPKSVLVGTSARNQYALYPERTVRSIKRKMGQEVKVTLADQEYSPPEISAMILRELKRRAEALLSEPVERAVITVPAYFSDAARHATHEAGEIAGFTVERIINEPTAAALAYGLDRSEEDQLVAVYDLGGGTFDVSIIELAGGIVEVRASHGDTELGGDDFDQRLADWLAEGFIEQYGVDPRQDQRANARLLRAAEEAKIKLSSQPFVTVREEYLMTQGGKPLHLEREVSRSEFEELIVDLIEGTLQSLDAALRDAKLSVEELSRILFVGGSTRIPLVWQMVHQHTGLEPEVAINPDEAVALGAAVQAAIIAGEPLDAILVDVTPHSLGIAVAEIAFGQLQPDRYSVLIPRNTTIPTSRSEVYSALTPSQTAIQLKIYQGEEPIASHNTLLGEFLFDQLRPESPGQPPRITVQFDFDVNGILHVSAVDRGSGKQANSSVKATKTRLSASEITSARTNLTELDWAGFDEAEDYEDEDEDYEGEDKDSNIIELRPAAAAASPIPLETLGALSRTRKLIESKTYDTADLEQVVKNLERAIKQNDSQQTADLTEELLDLLYDFE
jgi:molecular chaperone DnaK